MLFQEIFMNCLTTQNCPRSSLQFFLEIPTYLLNSNNFDTNVKIVYAFGIFEFTSRLQTDSSSIANVYHHRFVFVIVIQSAVVFVVRSIHSGHRMRKWSNEKCLLT